jgi:uncharacterized glyoxalase superfamily protein PhnB
MTNHIHVWPTLRYRDALAAIDFLESAFGFKRRAVHLSDADPTVVEHAELDWPMGGAIMLGSLRESVEWPAESGAGATYVVTDQPDALFKRATEAGAQVLRAPREEDYGSRDFVVRDPEGNLWSFGTYAGE